MEDKIRVGKERLEKMVINIKLKTNNTINNAKAFTPNGKEENNSANQIKGSSDQSACGLITMVIYKIKKAKAKLK